MEIKRISKNDILYIDNETRVEFSKGRLIYYKNEQEIARASLYNTPLYRILSKIAIMVRLLRLEPRWMTKIDCDRFLISNQGKLIIMDLKNNNQKNIFEYNKGTNNPLHFCEYKRNGETEIVFGDYGGRDATNKVGVFRYKNETVSQIGSIDGKKIDHIHRVEYDRFKDCYWIFTGDFDAGCGIWKLNYNESEIKSFLLGKQSYRACVAKVFEDSIIYATDMPNEMNYIFKLNVNDKTINKIEKLPGSCIYGHVVSEERMCLSTTVEHDSTLPKWRYIFSYKLGKGIQDRYSHIFIGNHINGFDEIWKTKKDMLPMFFFQFGNIKFPTQHKKNEIIFFTQSSVNKGTYKIKMNGGNKND